MLVSSFVRIIIQMFGDYLDSSPHCPCLGFLERVPGEVGSPRGWDPLCQTPFPTRPGRSGQGGLAQPVLIAPVGGSRLRHRPHLIVSGRASSFGRGRAASRAGRGRDAARAFGMSIAAAPSPLRELGFPGVCADSQ